MTSHDLATFAVAFALVWIGLGAYLVYLHRLSERLAREVEFLEERERTRRENPNPPRR